MFLAQRMTLGLLPVLLASDLLNRAYAMSVYAVGLAMVFAHLRAFASSSVNAFHSAESNAAQHSTRERQLRQLGKQSDRTAVQSRLEYRHDACMSPQSI